MNKTNVTKRVLPIRFHRLRDGSDFIIFAEPSRNIRASEDKTLYTKVEDSYSVAKGVVPEKAIILFPEDLVVPMSKGEK